MLLVSDDPERCYAAAMRILSYRFNSEGELRRKLEMKEFGRELIEATIARLRDEKWLDDDRFAAAYVRTRVRKGIGLLRIKRELIAAGVESDIIARALDESLPDHDERAAALASARIRSVSLLISILWRAAARSPYFSPGLWSARHAGAVLQFDLPDLPPE